MNDCLSLRERYFAPGAQADAIWRAHLAGCPECRLAVDNLPQVDRALSGLARAQVEVPDFSTVAAAAASAARMQRQRRLVRRSAPFFYTGLAAAALAAAVAAAVLVGKNRAAAPTLLVVGHELRATSEAKTARLSNGARVRLDTGTLKLTADDREAQALVLTGGRLFLEVPKLPAGSTLTVRTPDADVRVRGTRFQVIRTANQETQVQVTEGLVEVRPEGLGRPVQFLHAGESTTVSSAEVYRETLRRSTLAALDHGQFAAAEAHIDELLGTSAGAAQKAEAQALLAWSLSAKGQRSEAIARYRQALALLPAGRQVLWAENACAELSILLERERPTEAAAAWADCLRRFPNGVHAELARSRAHSSR
jgi:ferric-dicitrate binding protein FerR (iron transport regulator)